MVIKLTTVLDISYLTAFILNQARKYGNTDEPLESQKKDKNEKTIQTDL